MAGGVASNKTIPPINHSFQASPDDWVSITMPMKNAIDVMAGRIGNALDKAVTLQDLVTLGLVTQQEVLTKLAGPT